MDFLLKEYVRYRRGVHNPYVLVDALHSTAPRAEVFTDEIAERISAAGGCHCIVCTVSREVADLNRWPNRSNRDAVIEYRQTIYDLLSQSNVLDDNNRLRLPLLHISLHGMRDRSYMDVELGTVFGDSCSDRYLQWMLDRFGRWAEGLEHSRRTPIVVDNRELYGEPVIAVHRLGDGSSDYPGYGNSFNTVQIELAQWLRIGHREDLVTLLTAMAEEFRAFATG